MILTDCASFLQNELLKRNMSILCWYSLLHRRQKVEEDPKVADVRAKAPIPQSGKVGPDEIVDSYSVTDSAGNLPFYLFWFKHIRRFILI